MSGRLHDKVVVIIGGTTGLGISGARACIADGAKVVVVGRNSQNVEAADQELGDSGAAIEGDAMKPDTATRAIELAITKFGGFDGLYHVAGGSGRKWGDGPLDEITDEGWDQTLCFNLTSLFNSNRAAVKQFMKQQSGGSVLNMGSVLADSPSPKYFATHTYATAKAGIVGLTRAAASYYANRNIRFNVVAPALVETPLTERAMSDEEIINYIATKQPLDGGRIAQPADVDAAAVYLLSDESSFITGQVLRVDGGWSVSDGQHSTT